MKEGNKLQSNPHLACMICHGHMVIKKAKRSANFFPKNFLASKKARIMVRILNKKDGSLTTNKENPKILMKKLAKAAYNTLCPPPKLIR